uniref:Uncharacterized protein n=1 Tax=Arundo donax TaxID=35708 RepID=A0A0A9AFU2_ARUDO
MWNIGAVPLLSYLNLALKFMLLTLHRHCVHTQLMKI